jgi:hypothetical protein
MADQHNVSATGGRLGESFLDDLQRWWMNLIPGRRRERTLREARTISARELAQPCWVDEDERRRPSANPTAFASDAPTDADR